jgi:hypothetical protein
MHQLTALPNGLASERNQNCRFNLFAEPTGVQID